MKWARADGTGIISENATGRCAARDPVAVLNACAIAGALESVHNKIIESGCEFVVFVGSSLVDIYAKCGSMEDAWRMFNKMSVALQCQTHCTRTGVKHPQIMV
jgi:pentatricopeptide repeat protein